MKLDDLPEKPDAAFEIIFEGRTVLPERIPLGVLATTLSAIQNLASGEETLDEEDEVDGSLRLMGMRRGSAIFEIYAPSPALAMDHLRQTGRVIDRSESIDDLDHLLSPLERLSGTARRMGCWIILKEPGEGGAILARVGGSTYHDLSQSMFIKGPTTIMASVQRVGGVEKLRCVLRVPDRLRLLYCNVTRRDVARKMGNNLYETMILHGQASWLRNNWKLQAFTVEDAEILKEGKFSDAIEALREAGGKHWDGIADPQAFLDEIRGQD